MLPALEPILEAQQEKDASPVVDLTRATEVTPEVRTAIGDIFKDHPWNSAQDTQGALLRGDHERLMETIIEIVPPCPDRSCAMHKLREARTDCNSAITHGGKY